MRTTGPPLDRGGTVSALLLLMVSVLGVAACSSVTLTPKPTGSTAAPGTEAPNPPGSVMPPSVPAVASPTPAASSVADASPTTAPSLQAGTLDACSLLTAADLATALGRPGFESKPMPAGGWVAGQCAWNGPGSGFFLSVGTAASIEAFADPAAADAKAKLAQFKQQASSGGTPKDLKGIGDGAVLAAAGIAAYKEGTYLQLMNLGLTEDELVSVMRAALANL